jgi:hypothetical protein
MRWLVLLFAILTSGCWTGEKLYSASDAVSAIPAGQYYDDLATRVKTGRVSINPNGMTKLVPDDPHDKATLLGFSALDAEQARFVIWTSDEVDGRQVDDAGIYGLLVRIDDKYSFYMPNCRETTDVAIAAGAQIEKGMADQCRFPNRASLEKALRQWQPKPDQAMARFRRIGG